MLQAASVRAKGQKKAAEPVPSHKCSGCRCKVSPDSGDAAGHTSPVDTAELYQQGFEARCSGDYQTAEQRLRQVLQQVPGHPDALWQLGLIQGFLGDFDGSLATLQSVVTAHPRHVKALYDLGMTEMMLGMMDEACATFRKVLMLEPMHEDAARQLVYCP